MLFPVVPQATVRPLSCSGKFLRASICVLSALEREEFDKSCNLIGSWRRQNFLIGPPQREKSVVLICFRERISGTLHFFTLLKAIKSTQVCFYSPLNSKERHCN